MAKQLYEMVVSVVDVTDSRKQAKWSYILVLTISPIHYIFQNAIHVNVILVDKEYL